MFHMWHVSTWLLIVACVCSPLISAAASAADVADADANTAPTFDSTLETRPDETTEESSSAPKQPDFPDKNVYERGLVVNDITPQAILEHHAKPNKAFEIKHFVGETLGYVTPWNAAGMQIAIGTGPKLDFIAPVWYQIKIEYNKEKKLQVKITGGHDVNEKFLGMLKRTATRTVAGGEVIRSRIVPRFIVEVKENMYSKIAENTNLQNSIMRKVSRELDKWKFDGLVLEMTDAWARVGQNKKARKALNSFLNRWGDSLHAEKLKKALILVVRPYFPDSPYFGHADFMATHQHVDRFQIMTYDYSHQAPGPCGPINWVFAVLREFVGANNMENEALTRQVMIGLNFYGLDFAPSGPKAILGAEYAKILMNHTDSAVFDWNEEWGEHRLNYTIAKEDGTFEPHQVFYPSLKSLALRLSMAAKLKVGVAIWELGQGLNYFWDLF